MGQLAVALYSQTASFVIGTLQDCTPPQHYTATLEELTELIGVL